MKQKMYETWTTQSKVMSNRKKIKGAKPKGKAKESYTKRHLRDPSLCLTVEKKKTLALERMLAIVKLKK